MILFNLIDVIFFYAENGKAFDVNPLCTDILIKLGSVNMPNDGHSFIGPKSMGEFIVAGRFSLTSTILLRG